MKKLKILLMLGLLLCLGFALSTEVHAEEITNLTGTKWLLNETFTKMPNGDSFFYSGYESGCYFTINFISNSNNYTYLGFEHDDYSDWGIEYGISIFVWSGTWVNPNYRTIEFTGEVTGGSLDMTNSILIAWLKANATQIIEEPSNAKPFEVGDVLPITSRLRISWVGDILDIPHARYIDTYTGWSTLVSIFNDIIHIKDSMETRTKIYDGSNFIPPYTNYDGDHAYIEIDTTTWNIGNRTITRVDTGMDIFTWEDMYANFEEGYLEARERYGYYDSITEQWLSVEEYLDLYGTDKPGQSDFYANFDKYFIPAMIIIFGGAIVLTLLKVFKGRE